MSCRAKIGCRYIFDVATFSLDGRKSRVRAEQQRNLALESYAIESFSLSQERGRVRKNGKRHTCVGVILHRHLLLQLP